MSGVWPSRVLLALGLLVLVMFTVLSIPEDLRSAITVVCIALMAGLVLVAARRSSFAADAVWRLLLIGLLIQLIGQALWTSTSPANRDVGTAAWIDLVFLLSYLVTATGLALLVHRRGRDRDVPALLDAAVLTIAAGSVFFLLSSTPPWELTQPADGGPEQAIAAAYVIADLSLLALSCSLLRGADRRNPALLLIVGSLLVSFISDALMDGIVLTDGWQWTSPAPIEGAWLLSYAMLGAAIVHPAAMAATAPAVSPRVRLSWHGVLILALAGLAVPAAAVYSQLVQQLDRTISLAVAGSALLVVILARLAVLVQSVQGEADVFEEQSRRDQLTGLANRRTMDLSLARMMISAGAQTDTVISSHTRRLTVAMIDLDHFKAYNDSHGHAGGDELLRRAANAWAGVLVDSAQDRSPHHAPLLARYGGEEFALLAPDWTVAQVREMLERMLAVTPDGQSFSAGIHPWDGLADSDALLAGADAQLYRAKQAGRSRILPDCPAPN